MIKDNFDSNKYEKVKKNQEYEENLKSTEEVFCNLGITTD